jgi:hypothetical protein
LLKFANALHELGPAVLLSRLIVTLQALYAQMLRPVY